MTREEGHLRVALIIGAVLFGVEAAIYIPEVFRGPSATRPFAINSVAKDTLFCALTAVAAADLRRYARLIGFVILGHAVIILMLVLAIATGNTGFSFPPPRWLVDIAPGLDMSPGLRAWSWLAGCTLATAVLIWLYHRALMVRDGLLYLWPTERDTLAAVADAILSHPKVPPREIAARIDRYWAGLDIGYKIRLRAALWLVFLLPLRWLRPPLPFVERESRRKLIDDRMLRAISSRSGLGPLRTMAQSAIRFAMQLVYIGYYDDPRSYVDTEYERFTDRPEKEGEDRTPRRPQRPLRVLPRPSGDTPLRADVVVVGSGAGGSIAAHMLAEAGHDVLIVERGAHVDPDTFSEDEADQYARLYSDGALQLSRDFSFQVLQGMCVGGGTVVNNAICLDPPPAVLGRWNEPELDAGLPLDDVMASVLDVRDLIGANRQHAAPPNPIVHKVGAPPMGPVSANIRDCLGSGYCNIGCKWGRKLSMLDTVLPDTQRTTDERRLRDPGFKGRLRILPDCEVTEIQVRDGRAAGLAAEMRLPKGKRSPIEIDAGTVVLAAGAIHSSRLLMASGIGGDLVGRELCANIGSHMTGYWPHGNPVRAFEGLQMSHLLEDDEEPTDDYKIEAWFNPVMSQALVMPGWLGDHQRNMKRYARLGVLGVISGSTRNGNRVLRRRQWPSGAEIDFTPSEADLGRLLSGLRHAGRVLLDHGAECVMPLTFRYRELTLDNLDRLDLGQYVEDASDISVNTAHPQGGNPISRDPAKGVVNERLRVHGVRNLYICDASVFPTSIEVNPQLTVMALSHYAAQRIA